MSSASSPAFLPSTRSVSLPLAKVRVVVASTLPPSVSLTPVAAVVLVVRADVFSVAPFCAAKLTPVTPESLVPQPPDPRPISRLPPSCVACAI